MATTSPLTVSASANGQIIKPSLPPATTPVVQNVNPKQVGPVLPTTIKSSTTPISQTPSTPSSTINSGTETQGPDLAAFMAKVAAQQPQAPSSSSVADVSAGNAFIDSTGKTVYGSAPDRNVGLKTSADQTPGTNPDGTPISPSSDLNSLYQKYGVTQSSATPTSSGTTPVSLPDYTKDQNYQNSSNDLQTNLQRTLNDISAKYGVLGQQAEEQAGNTYQNEASGLSGLGETNPSGSSFASLRSLKDRNLTIAKADLAAKEGAEKTAAVKEAFNEAQTLRTNAQNLAQEQEQAQINENARLQQDFTDKWTAINNGVSLVKSGQSITQTEQNNNLTRLGSLLTTFGSSALNNVPADQLDNIAKSAGLPAGSLQPALKTMKEKELFGKLNLKQMFDGSLVNVSIGADGKPNMEILLPGGTQNVVNGIMNGTIPPTMKTLTKEQQGAVTMALAEKGFDLSKATSIWNATQTQIATLNNQQQTSLRQSVGTVSGQVNSLDTYNKAAEDAMSRAGITDFAKIQRSQAERGVFGNEVKKAFIALDGQIAEIVPELSKIYSGNGVGTDAKMDEAMKQLSADWDYATLKDNIDRVRENLGYRINAMNDFQVQGSGGGSPYLPNNNVQPVTDVQNVSWGSLLNSPTP